MKKITITILIILYFTTSIGATIRMHFCMGKMISWTLNTKEKDDKCSKCDMKCKKGCCEEKSQVVKIDKDQSLAKVFFEFSNSNFQIEPTLYLQWQPLVNASAAINFPTTNAPPDTGKVPLFVRNNAFLL